MDKVLNYYFEVWAINESFRRKISKEEAYGVLHLYGFSDDDWKKEEICVWSGNERMYSLVRSEKEYDCNVA